MRKVLIVDDDTIIRITLRSLINWEEMGFQIVADAIHGEAALAYLKDHTVDLIISDMKMPVLDGIGLLEAVSRFEVMPKVLVLSGYDDFKLVRDAFRLGACDYLLKADLNGELLKNMLEGLSGEWESEDEAGRQPGAEESRETISDSERLSAMAMGKCELDESFFDGEYLVVQFEIDEFQKHAGRFAGDFEGELIRPLLEFAAQIPRVASRCVLGTISPSRYAMLYRISDGAQYQDNVVSTCRQLCSVWNNFLNLPVSAGISTKGNGAGDFLARFEEAGGWLSLHWLKGKAAVCSPWERGSVDYLAAKDAFVRYKRLTVGLLTADEMAVSEEKQKLIAAFYRSGLSSAKQELLYLICNLAWILNESHDDIGALFAEKVNYYEKIGRLEEMGSLELWLNNYFRWVMDYAAHQNDRRQADMMSRAKRFIMDNYANPELTLGSVAGYVGLNEKYFSSRFTKEEGMTFSNYLTEVRIRKARELMEQTDLKIYEISQSVGYNSVEHFTRVFKKICQVSPGAYRK